MFRRTFWFTAGAAAGVWATTKVNRKLKQLTPESLAAQAADKAIEAGHKIKDFALDVRDGMVQREAELGEALGLNAHPDALPARRFAVIENRSPAKHDSSNDNKTKYIENPTYSYNRNEDH
ncbi:hypothetical protein DCW30_20085 [Streptomyces alfalfae]|uniref:Secreted protein n=1 Tax=Streptomyces alfalfae TaxID=1642299 RepID=A0A1P8TNW8_9ACTN|nr:MULTISPECIES: DUF6167 family protein [Streptomyces]AYA19718.1 hypothetical protein D3X13_28805 [Streptomyces fradiae]APY89293.1 hypothetical protein A7J05_29575 [Streptomyces alfalfae]KUL51832.1 hypothetical protein ADL30_25615 [Streptomyces sp. NRRL S-1521]QQC88301.1 hypothetical protein I8755_07635 [Streptomyces alfalfae]QUI30758.1 hypothetical protein H9W91_07690 [Streptomyces alfalfae]